MGLNAIRLGIAWEGVMPAPGEVSEAYGDTGARPLSSDHGRPFASRVRTVAVPYPQRTAGRDARWSFDRADRRFTLRYRPLGGAETVVALARAAFPAGRSGAPAPTARAEMLRLRPRDGVRSAVTVTAGRALIRRRHSVRAT